jgi:hypothetical protein
MISDTIITQPLRDSLLDSSVSFGILPKSHHETENPLFDINYYGPQPIVEMPLWPFARATMLIDILPSWERLKGRFWVRSQMVHYIWEQWHGGHGSLPSQKTSSRKDKHPYIAFYWSSSKSLRKNLAVKFGRNASVTQDFGRYMEVAERIRDLYLPSMNTIYLFTDGIDELPLPKELKSKWPSSSWEFVSPFLPTSSETTWDEEKRILAGLEMMRRADFLVGSFQSQLFRLACELNAAWFPTQYSITTRRHWTLDVEWFENP